MASLITIFATLFGVLVLYGVSKCVGWVVTGVKASRGGYVVFEDGRSGVWVREREGWEKWWRRVRGKESEGEVQEVDEGTGRRGWFWWNGRSEERRPLLQ